MLGIKWWLNNYFKIKYNENWDEKIRFGNEEVDGDDYCGNSFVRKERIEFKVLWGE